MSVSYFGRFLVLAFFSALFLCSYSYASPVLKDANDELIGSFLGYIAPRGPSQSQAGESDFLMITRTGYVFALSYQWEQYEWADPNTSAVIRPFTGYSLGGSTSLFFKSTDCSGQGYLQGVQSGIVSNYGYTLSKIYEKESTVEMLYYVPKGAQSVTIDSFSRFNTTADSVYCSSSPTYRLRAVEAMPNDPAVTGISKSHFPLPVYFDFDYRFGTPEVFIDRFITAEQSSR